MEREENILRITNKNVGVSTRLIANEPQVLAVITVWEALNRNGRKPDHL